MRLILLFVILSSLLFSQSEGDNLTLHENGDTAVYFYIHQGKKEGYEQVFYPNVQWESVENFNKGERVGWWKWYYENGKVRTEGEFVQNSKEGYWRYYDDSGMVINQGWYEDGLKSGYWYEFSPKDKDILSLNYDYKPLINISITDSSGIVDKDLYYLEKVAQNYWCTSHEGYYAKGHYEIGLKDGWWEYYSGTQLVKAGYYFEGKRVGEWGELVEGKWYLIDFGSL